MFHIVVMVFCRCFLLIVAPRVIGILDGGSVTFLHAQRKVPDLEGGPGPVLLGSCQAEWVGLQLNFKLQRVGTRFQDD